MEATTNELETLKARIERVETDLKTATHAHGKVAGTGAYQNLAARCAHAATCLESHRKVLMGKLEQLEAHERAQREYKELTAIEEAIDELYSRYDLR